MDGWMTIVSFGGPTYFQGRTVDFRESPIYPDAPCMIYLPTCTIKTNHNQIYKYTMHGAYGICFYSSPGVFAIFRPYIINKSTVGPARTRGVCLRCERWNLGRNGGQCRNMAIQRRIHLCLGLSGSLLGFGETAWAPPNRVLWRRHFVEAKVMEVWMVQDVVFLFQYLSFQAGKNGPQPSICCWESPQQFYAIFVQLFFLNREQTGGEVRFIWPPTPAEKSMKSRFVQGYQWSYIGTPISSVI